MTFSALWEHSNQGAGAPGLESSDVFLPGLEMVLGMHLDPFGGPSRISVHSHSLLILCSYSITWAFNFCLCFLKPVAFVIFCSSTAAKETYSEGEAAGQSTQRCSATSRFPCDTQAQYAQGARKSCPAVSDSPLHGGIFSSLLHDPIIFNNYIIVHGADDPAFPDYSILDYSQDCIYFEYPSNESLPLYHLCFLLNYFLVIHFRKRNFRVHQGINFSVALDTDVDCLLSKPKCSIVGHRQGTGCSLALHSTIKMSFPPTEKVQAASIT